ncbi:AraC family transcriptional regulator [Myxococcus sp. RHSTA-1-4]|uniref:helix-turn-helix domain-containing protein n=1 Tax=Myxococcus sp. RHSTA-1-4 TaxID=2874601 RepID=UPI001CC18A7A|nr:AraC family transcriptional regulator [Myxococcus sp. RHSTA-1-4]MBZ4419035.1 AraC family transcriptional regulator [Myxococcus sp. RHSTA-1-4]
MIHSENGQPRGILNLKAGERKFDLTRLLPSEDLAFFVSHYWIVTWDLRGQEPYVAEVLSHPTVHLAIEQGRTEIHGVVKKKFTRKIEGRGRTFGVKFHPGAFYPFVNFPVSRLADKRVSLESALGLDTRALETAVLGHEDDRACAAEVERFLRTRLPSRDDTVARVRSIVERIIADPELIKVDALVDEFGLSKRALQRLFSQYVGVGPKWVIQRFRLHEAAERLAKLDGGEPPRLADLAASLGYFDQAHFIKDFKALVGLSPADYLRRLRGA